MMPRTLHSGKRLVCCLLLGIFFCLPGANTWAQGGASADLKVIGKVAMAKGVVTAHSDKRPLASLAKGSPIYLSDIIETATRSFAVMQFNDGGKVTLRPESRIDLNEYDDTAGQEKESFELLKGGLRAVTGAIGKAKPEEVKYTARNTTIGIRGTTLVIRLCDKGDEGCVVDGSNEDVAKVELNKQFVDIFVVDRKGGSRQRITRQQLSDLLEGVYVSVIEGAIRLFTANYIIDMTAGDKCVIGLSADGQALSPSAQGIECFIPGPGLEDGDVFLGPNAEEITLFNLFDDTENFVGNEICEID